MASKGNLVRETDPTPVRILVVDDSAVARAVVGHGLKAAGMRVDDAKSATEALQLLAGNSYDVVISDLCMPGVDGFALLVRIKMQAPATQVIILSGLEDRESATKALKLGAREYLPKPPAHPGDVLAAVHRVLETKRLRDYGFIRAAAARRAPAPRP
jgi:DNA-binding NtrC family response regulator